MWWQVLVLAQACQSSLTMWGAAVGDQRSAMTLGNKEVWHQWEVCLCARVCYSGDSTSGTSEESSDCSKGHRSGRSVPPTACHQPFMSQHYQCPYPCIHAAPWPILVSWWQKGMHMEPFWETRLSERLCCVEVSLVWEGGMFSLIIFSLKDQRNNTHKGVTVSWPPL